MLFTPKALLSSSVGISIVFLVVCMEVSLSYGIHCPGLTPPSCDCSNTPDGYELRCSAFTVQVKPKAVFNIECNTNIVSDFSVLSGTCVGEVDTLIIRQCQLSSVSLSHVMQSMCVSNVSNVQLTYTGNSTATVTRDLFHGLSNVTSVTLHTNGTAQLTDDLFNDMPNLTFIDLQSNNIVFSKNIFCSVMNLQVLQLGFNDPVYLEAGIFQKLSQLRLLSLWGNVFNLSSAVFSNMYNLESLYINLTKMTGLPSDLFVDLTRLKIINLNANEFISLPKRLFINNRYLETVNLQDNRRTLNTLPPKMLADLLKLKIITIHNCNMSKLPEDLLWGSVSINTITLTNNAFITLPETLFKDCRELQSLDISYNRITDLPNQIFSSVLNLKYLKINNNQLAVIINQWFSSLRNLMVLDLKDNRLTHVETQAFEMLTSLKAVNLSNNMLTFDEMRLSPLKSCRMLENIQLSNNSVIRIFPDWRNLLKLETLNLAYNKISHIPFSDLEFVNKNDITVNVSCNNISEIDIIGKGKEVFDETYAPRTATETYISLLRSIVSTVSVRHFFIDGNLIKCDCNVPNLVLLGSRAIFKFMMTTGSENSQCVRREKYREYSFSEFFSIKVFSCFLRKRYTLNCPEQCNCLLMVSDKALLVECNQKNLTSMKTQGGTLPNLSRVTFSDVHNLKFLEINSIRMPGLPSDLLLDLSELRIINLHGNEFLSLPHNMFVNNRNLIGVYIVDNRRTLNTLPPAFLSYLIHLQEFKLSSCNTFTLPEDLLWGSTNIRSIALNRNAFTTVPKLLLKSCWKLRSLDLSYNRITDLPIGLFQSTGFLYELDISNNQLSIIPKDLFAPLELLNFLYIKDNKLRHIEPLAFFNLQSLKSVDMSNNILTFADTSENSEMGLSRLEYLRDIQLSNNSVANIFSDWRKLKPLQTLNLAHNKISRLRAEDLNFIGAQNTFVNISYNNISNIDIFDNERFFKYVSETAIYKVPIRHFFIEGNPIECDCNIYRFLQNDGENVIAKIKITTKTNTSSSQCVKLKAYTGQMLNKIPKKYFTCLLKAEYRLNCPEHCSCTLFPKIKTMVVDCHLINKTSTVAREIFPPNLFADLKNVKTISIYASRFQSFPQNLFVKNSYLEVINIENNEEKLKTLPPRFLADLNKLKEIRLNSCNICSIPENLLWRSTSINSISMNNNALTTIPELLFRDCIDLRFLDISFNRITDLPSLLFSGARNLKTLKINNNQLTVIKNNLLSFLEPLEVLDLKNNRLSYIESEAFDRLITLRVVDMSNNMLAYVHYSSLFAGCYSLQDIQLANNSVDRVFYLPYKNKLHTLNLAHNKISQLLAEDLDFSSAKNTFVNLSYNNITEIVLFDTESDIKYVPKIRQYNVPFRLILIEGNPIKCMCKVYSLLQYRREVVTKEVKFTMETEPLNIQCLTPGEHKAIPMKYFSCLFKKYYSLNCPEKCSCIFTTTDETLKVECQQKNLTSIPGALPDIEFSSCTELNLSGNKIKSVKFPLGPGYNKVTKYKLSDNMINEVDLAAFSPQLEILELEGNNIKKLNKSSIEFLMNATSLTQLTLHNNPLRCDCTNKDLVNLIQNIYRLRKIKLLHNITCENGKEIMKINDTELCPVTSKIIVNEYYTVGLLFGLLVGLLIGCLLAFYYKFKNGIKIWLYAHRCCLSFVTEEELDQNRLYDAFVSYAYPDEAFVLDNLVPRLEEDYHYKLCLHQRDWIPGEFIPDQIARSVEDSRRTIIVLSTAFLESVWGRLEFCAAHRQALNEGRVRVIIILYGDIGSTGKLDTDLRTYLTTNTYVEWGDKWFWEKLRYAMPHSSKLRTDIPL